LFILLLANYENGVCLLKSILIEKHPVDKISEVLFNLFWESTADYNTLVNLGASSHWEKFLSESYVKRIVNISIRLLA
jgi:hypothetical protein